MAKKRMSRAEAELKAERIMEVAAAASHCLKRMRLIGKKLTRQQKKRLKGCIIGMVGPKKR